MRSNSSPTSLTPCRAGFPGHALALRQPGQGDGLTPTTSDSTPDPVIYYEVPTDGEYVIEIKDSIYRGREDFVYRITIGETPFITSIFPLGGPAGEKTTVQLKGWNLPVTSLTLDDSNKTPGIHPLSVRKDNHVSNFMPFAVNTLPECFAEKSRGGKSHAQRVTLPIIINGRIAEVR